jgi:CRP-like cAMP-binding protein
MNPNILVAARDYPAIDFAPGDVLISEGTVAPPIFVLLSGTVSVYRGDIRVSRTSLEGALFGEMSVLLDIPSTATVIADTPVTAARIDDSAAFLAERPEVALHSAKLLAQRLYDATTYLADLKRQFMDEESHLGMVDRILGSLLTQQLERPVKPDEDRADPRL